MENIEEFKRENEDKLLKYKYEERELIFVSYDYEMEFTLKQMRDYYDGVKHVIDHKLDYSIISHLTYNLNLELSHFHDVLSKYAKAFFYYLSVNRYDQNRDYWSRFQDEKEKIIALIDNFDDIRLFEIYAKHPGDVFAHCHLNFGLKDKYKPLLGLEKDLAIMNGVQLLKSLEKLLDLMDEELTGLKDEFLYENSEVFELVYDLNYVFYADKFWDKEHFRNHTARELMNNVTPDRLEDYYRHEIRTFKTNALGEVWERYSEDREKIAYELNRMKIDQSQWEFFFKYIFRFEELERWINELRNPESIDTADYPVSQWDCIFKDAIDVKKVKAILPKLLSDSFTRPNLFVVHKVFEEIDWLQDETDTHFIGWAKDIYGCTFSSNDFKPIKSAFKKRHFMDWTPRIITAGAIAKDYIELAQRLRKEFVKKMSGKNVLEDNISYFKKPDLYIQHKKWE